MTDFALWSGSNFYDLLSTPDTGGSQGLEIINAAANNVKGAYTQIIASTTRYYSGLVLQFMTSGNTTDATTSLVDIAFGTTVVIPDILSYGEAIEYAGNQVYFPIGVPSGTQLQVRVQQRINQGSPAIAVWGVPGSPTMPSPYGRVTNYGANTTDSGGVEIDCGASSNTRVRTQVVASTTNPMKHMILCFGDVGITSRAISRFLFDLEIGAGDEIIFAGMMLKGSNSEVLHPTHVGFPVNLPAGTEININAQCSGTVDAQSREFDVVILGID